MTIKLLAAAILFTGVCSAHRLDEYLPLPPISLAKDHASIEVRLTPGVAVAPLILKTIDTNADGAISNAEQSTYIQRFLNDVSLTLDNQPVTFHPSHRKHSPTSKISKKAAASFRSRSKRTSQVPIQRTASFSLKIATGAPSARISSMSSHPRTLRYISTRSSEITSNPLITCPIRRRPR